jgi:Cu/Ag efflux protein CusF
MQNKSFRLTPDAAPAAGGGITGRAAITVIAFAAPPAPAVHTPTAMAPMRLKIARGTIKLIDAKACTITLTSRNVYQFEPKCDFSKLKVGERVSLKWATKGKVRDGMSIASR